MINVVYVPTRPIPFRNVPQGALFIAEDEHELPTLYQKSGPLAGPVKGPIPRELMHLATPPRELEFNGDYEVALVLT